jgi:hypothetical protein
VATCVLITAMPRCAAVLQFLLSPLLLWRSFMSTALANAVYAAALCHYHYLNFLGYSALPFLERTEVSGGGSSSSSSSSSGTSSICCRCSMPPAHGALRRSTAQEQQQDNFLSGDWYSTSLQDCLVTAAAASCADWLASSAALLCCKRFVRSWHRACGLAARLKES